MKAPTSIYRQHAGLVYAVADPVNRSNPDGQTWPEFPCGFTQQRRPSPVAALLPTTQEWLDALPRRVQPYLLCKLYPRIANIIAAKWLDTEALRAYFDGLLVDRRRGRRGFPLEVLNDLCAVLDYHATLNSHAKNK
jgi:hypothetical protein